jgi:Protein of unknown function (DUF5663)
MPEKKKGSIKLSTDLLVELGYEKLTKDQANLLLKELYRTLETVVGVQLSNKMTPEEIDTFIGFVDADEESRALKWLEENFGEYKEEVREALDGLERELREVSGAPEPDKSAPGPEAIAGSG